LRRLAVIDGGFAENQAGLGPDPAKTSAPDPRTTVLLQLAVPVATQPSAVCLEWSTVRALAASATEDEIADVLLTTARGWAQVKRLSPQRSGGDTGR
jgi:hypothetical protein